MIVDHIVDHISLTVLQGGFVILNTFIQNKSQEK